MLTVHAVFPLAADRTVPIVEGIIVAVWVWAAITANSEVVPPIDLRGHGITPKSLRAALNVRSLADRATTCHLVKHTPPTLAPVRSRVCRLAWSKLA